MPTTDTCSNCGQAPVGEACYHICFNSIHYYSPEQERYDDAMDDGSDDIRERYASTAADADMFFEDEEAEREAIEHNAPVGVPASLFVSGDPADNDDIPF